jgi:hypothetical protein
MALPWAAFYSTVYDAAKRRPPAVHAIRGPAHVADILWPPSSSARSFGRDALRSMPAATSRHIFVAAFATVLRTQAPMAIGCATRNSDFMKPPTRK